MSVGHPRGTHSRYVISCCLIPLGIYGLNSKRITYGIGCKWGMPSLSPLSSLVPIVYYKNVFGTLPLFLIFVVVCFTFFKGIDGRFSGPLTALITEILEYVRIC